MVGTHPPQTLPKYEICDLRIRILTSLAVEFGGLLWVWLYLCFGHGYGKDKGYGMVMAMVMVLVWVTLWLWYGHVYVNRVML